MKKLKLILTILSLSLIASCAPGVSSEVDQLPELEPYAGSKAKLVLGEFSCPARN